MATLTLKKASEWATSTGIYVCDPHRPGLKKKNGPFWSVVETRDGLDGYLRWLLEKNWWDFNEEGHRPADGNVKITLQPPSWRSHISVTRGERPQKNIDKWGWKNGKVITFSYSTKPRKAVQDGTEFWVVDVLSNELMEIRDFYGLETFYKFHLTIGRREL